MKKFFVLFIAAICANTVFAQNLASIDESIEQAANFLSERIPAGTSVAVFNFSSDSRKLSDYIVDELTIALTNTGMNVYDRKNLNEVNREIHYGEGDAVDENTAQIFGRDVGAQTVILGSITKNSDTEYRLRVQAIVVETKRVQAGRTINVKEDKQLLSLLNIAIRNEYRFTNAEKTQAGFKNMLFGWGSFQMGDQLGGGSVLAMEIVSVGVIAVGVLDSLGIFNLGGAKPETRDFVVEGNWGGGNPPGVQWQGGYFYDNFKYEAALDEYYEKNNKRRQALLISGGGGLALTWTWGFIRPFMYDKPVTVQKVAGVIDHVKIGLVPMSNGTTNVNVMLNYRF